LDRNEFLTRMWAASEEGELISTCAWCGRMRLDGEWVKPPSGALLTVDQPMTLSHSICPTCFAANGQLPESRDSPK
jgi:hypothetical protein